MNDMWDKRYSDKNFFYGTEPNDFLRWNVANFPAGGKILMLAEGEGRNAIFLAKHGFNVTAVDWSEVGLKKLVNWAEKEGVTVETICSDVNQFDFGTNAWDGIVSIWFHLASRDRPAIYTRCVKALKSRGVFLLEAYTTKQIKFKTGGPSDPDMLPNLQELNNHLSQLQIMSAADLERDIQEGEGHRGRSAVVQFLGQKP